MINPAQIPDEVVEAAADELIDTVECNERCARIRRSYADTPCKCAQLSRAVLAAALNAWPNAKTLRDDGRRQTYIVPALILPLTTGTSNDR
jgi:hypothetical protein